MPQNEHIELHRKRYGRRFDHEERTRKKEAREPRVRIGNYKFVAGTSMCNHLNQCSFP